MSILAIQSDLQMVHFTVPFMELGWKNPETLDPHVEIRDFFSQYEVNFELEASELKEKPSEFFIFLDTKINQGENAMPGYQLKMVGNGFFRIRNFEAHSQEVVNNFKSISAVSMMINTIRAALSDMTSYGPQGRYNLPAIDIMSLLREKAKQETPKESVRPAKKVKGT
jgi:preprotein translocase subunit SecB